MIAFRLWPQRNIVSYDIYRSDLSRTQTEFPLGLMPRVSILHTARLRYPPQHRPDEILVQRLALGNVGRRAFDAFAGRFTVSLTSSLVGGADLFLLLAQVIASLVSPAAGLFTRLACPFSHVVWDFSRDLANAL